MTTAPEDSYETGPRRRPRTWYQRRDVLFLAAVAIAWLMWEGYGRLTAPSRMTTALAMALARDPEQLNVLVTAKFPPERFHSNLYNELGTQHGTEGSTTKLMAVKPAAVRWLARQYWIAELDLAPPKL